MLNALRTDNSPFSEQQIYALRQGLGLLDRAQTAWLSGYLAGKLTGEQGALPPVALPHRGKVSSRYFMLLRPATVRFWRKHWHNRQSRPAYRPVHSH